MGARDTPAFEGRSQALRGAMLALLVERPCHGYELAHRLNRRLGPTWKVGARQLYPHLDEMTAAGLLTPVAEPSPGRPRQARVVYRPTPAGIAALDRWRRSELETTPLRLDLLARIATATRDDADAVLRVLDDYEAELLRTLEDAAEPDIPVTSWSTLMLALRRDYTDANLRSALQWVDSARRRIREHLASGGG